MIIYLKSGQTIDMGDVTKAIDDSDCEYKAMKYSEEGDLCIMPSTDDEDDKYATLTFYNTDNERLVLNYGEIVGIREDIQ